MGRLRNNPNAINLIKQYANCIDFNKIPWKQFKKAHLEIGSGKGDFLIQKSLQNPNILFVGVEKYPTVVLKALNKIKKNQFDLENLYFICNDIIKIPTNEYNKKITKIYLNFSDPWPKKRHENKRLTSHIFLDIYKKILVKNGVVEFKTDNLNFYLWSMQQLKSKKDILIVYKTNNLYENIDNEFNSDNIQTEYEKKFLSFGKSICKIIFKFKN